MIRCLLNMMTRADEFVFQASIEEFSALRTEIMARIKLRDQLMLVAIGAAGALLSFAYSGPASDVGSHRGLALYLVAPITSAMGGLWISNNWNMYSIHFYIIEVLTTRVNAILQAGGSQATVLGWEASLQRGSKPPFLRSLEWLFFFVSFALTGIAAQLLLLESSHGIYDGFLRLRFPAVYAVNCILISGVLFGGLVSVVLRRKREPTKGPLVN